jgi:hypothetical protein
MSRMEMIYIDTDGQARKAGVGAIMDTPLQTWQAFRSAKVLEVAISDADFILDYYNRNGDLSESIALSSSAYTQITGEPVLSDSEYRKIDADFWSGVRQEMQAARQLRDGGAA